MTRPLLASRRLVVLLPALSLALAAAAAPDPWLPNRPGIPPQVRPPMMASRVQAVLLDASDRALDRLGRPAAFVTDNRVRIGLIAPFAELSTPAGIADQAELTNDLKGSLNEAAVMVAAEARPAFHAAIARLPAGGIGQEGSAARYLWKTATPELWTALRPLVRREMARNGAYGHLYTLHTIIDFGPDYPALRERLTDSATDQILYAIFVYTAEEEHRMTGAPPTGIAPPRRF